MKKKSNYLFSIITLLLCYSLALAQIKIEVPQSPGSATDITVRSSTTPLPKATASPASTTDTDKVALAGVKVKLYYFREATKIVALLNEIKKSAKANLSNLIIQNPTEDEIILFGFVGRFKAFY